MLLDGILMDLVRVGHLTALALGLGLAIFLDTRTLSRLIRPLSAEDLSLIKTVHTAIVISLVGLWASGLILLYVRTGFDLENFSPKLWIKLGAVTMLTLNAGLISVVIFPVLQASVGVALVRLPLVQRVVMSLIVSNSAFCWICGLMLGASAVLRTASWTVLLPLTGGLYLVLTGVALWLAIVQMRRLIPMTRLAALQDPKPVLSS